MKISIPHPDEGSPKVGDEIAWRRELKQLRVRVAQLEQERKTRMDPSIDVKQGDKHGLQCGSPCAVVVLERQPRVECAACGTALDPVEVLRAYAKHERNFCYSLEHLRKEKRELSTETLKLKKLRSRLRSLVNKKLPVILPPPPDGKKWDSYWIANQMLDYLVGLMPAESAHDAPVVVAAIAAEQEST